MQDEDEEKPPVTTVFVGNISDRAPDTMVRQMLQRCGNVLSWKRVQGASGKLQGEIIYICMLEMCLTTQTASCMYFQKWL